jgi:hypothetical protein
MDYLAYTDVDMDFVAPFEESLFETDLTFVYHPGFFSKKDILGHWGSNGVAKESLAIILSPSISEKLNDFIGMTSWSTKAIIWSIAANL